MAEQSETNEVSAETAFGKFKVRGSDIIAGTTLIVAVCGFTIGYFLWKTHSEESKQTVGGFVTAMEKLNGTQQALVKESRVLNCLISTDQKDRQRAYTDCERIAR